MRKGFKSIWSQEKIKRQIQPNRQAKEVSKPPESFSSSGYKTQKLQTIRRQKSPCLRKVHQDTFQTPLKFYSWFG